MDCPNCGVYNPDSRDICWRCDKPLPRPKEPKKTRDPAQAMRRIWIVVIIAVAVWILLTWLLPWLLGQGG